MKRFPFGSCVRAAAVLTACVLIRNVSGCADAAGDCELNPILQCGPWAPHKSTASTASTGSSGTGGADGGTGGKDGGSGGHGTGGADSGPPPSCVPSENSGAVADSCGVFVSPTGSNANPGTKDKPLQTLALALTKGTVIYACAGAMPYSEALNVTASVTLYGGLDCTKWTYSAETKTALTAPADAIPLTIASSASGVVIHEFAITAADATMAGGSSIGVLDNGTGLSLENVAVVVGAGVAGAAGTAQGQVMTPSTANGSDGADDAVCNIGGPIAGGGNGKNTCASVNLNGGAGGQGLASPSGGDGQTGEPMTPSNYGSGQTSTASCDPGTKGIDGTAGGPGTGARGIGSISSTGYQASAPTAAGMGLPGQGGGGGGGGRQCDVNGDFAGPSGGGGGAGGCGGGPGNPGQSGGSSIGIVALGGGLTLTTVTITTAAGGTGGLGGDGQGGGNGGLAGHAVGGAACDGGKGGQGGTGGPGGGGAGGHSLGIAFMGGTAPDLSTTTITYATAGMGGAGGNMDMTAQTKGDAGLACKTLDFSAGAPSCVP